jgi:hypothetical protein
MRNDNINYIEDVLSDYMNNNGVDKYLELVNSNDLLKKYVDLISKIDNDDYPRSYMNIISDNDLVTLIEYLKNTIV